MRSKNIDIEVRGTGDWEITVHNQKVLGLVTQFKRLLGYMAIIPYCWKHNLDMKPQGFYDERHFCPECEKEDNRY